MIDLVVSFNTNQGSLHQNRSAGPWIRVRPGFENIFQGLSMDRIWGGFMDEIKEEGEDGKIPEPETPETKARRALNEKTKKRRRRRARNQMAPSAVKTTSKISKNHKIPFCLEIDYF